MTISAVLYIEYVEFYPETYEGVSLWLEDDRRINFCTGDMGQDIDGMLSYCAINDVEYTVSSSVYDFLMDGGPEPVPEHGVDELYAARMRLRIYHDMLGRSWRDIASRSEYAELSHATLSDIASGHEPSAATCRKLGIRKTNRYRLCYEAGRGPEGKAKRDQLKDEIEWAGCESFTEYVDYLREFGYR